MIELFLIQYLLVTILAIIVTEKFVPTEQPWQWKQAHKIERYLACCIPVYREIIMLAILWNKK
jgi:hypothetical protein